MLVLALIGAGALVITMALLVLPLAFAVFGDEMPGWVDDWGPFASYVLALVGALIIFTGIAYGVYA